MPLRNQARIGRGSFGILDKNISRKQAILSILGDGATHVAAGGINPIAVVRATGQILLLRKGGGSTRLFVGDTLEIDGFKRSDSTKFPNGPTFAFSIVTCPDDPPSPRLPRSTQHTLTLGTGTGPGTGVEPSFKPKPDVNENSGEIERL